MFPVGDENPTRRTPIVNHSLLVINIVVFLLEIGSGYEFIVRWSFIPLRLTALFNGVFDLSVVLTIFTSMFMHASIAHIGGNLLFLWIFGDNVEDTLGSGPYVLFYLLCGIGATGAQYLTNPLSQIPNLGASGAISGVLAAYMVLFPWARVRLFIWPLALIFGTIAVPALILIAFWFYLQLASGFQSLGMMVDEGGVAFWAHIGGFVTGLALIGAFKLRRRQSAQRSYRRRW